MDTLETVLRQNQSGTQERRDPLDIFREFIACLDRAARHRAGKATEPKERRPRK